MLVLLLACQFAPAAAPSYLPTPYDEHHLVVVRPDDLAAVDGTAVKMVEEPSAVFGKKAVAVDQPLAAELKMRHAGRYTLWVRIGQSLRGCEFLKLR